MSAEILIVDDEEDIRNLIKGILEDEGYKTRVAEGAESAYKAIEKRPPSLIILDIWLQGSEHDGLEILANVKKEHPYIPIVMISGHGTIETAVAAIKEGAYDFIEKPFKSDRLLVMITRALENAALRRENAALKKKTDSSRDLIGESPAIQQIREVLERVSPTNSRILLSGEPGTGKDVVAHLIHRYSERAQQPFLTVNCATLSPERLEAALFGSTEANESQKGLLEQADNGTLLLDEISDMTLQTQGKLIRFLQEGKFNRVGDNKQIEVDVRILASSNLDLEELIEQGDFRQDLYYRLNVVPIHMPPLKERARDIPALLEHLTERIAADSGLSTVEFAPDALKVMKAYDWPGNIRQLRNVIEWVLIMNGGNKGEPVKAAQLPPEIRNEVTAASPAAGGIESETIELPLRDAREIFERAYLQSQIDRFDGNISQTAKFVGMERSALHRKLKSLDILGSDKEDAEDEKKLKRA